MSVTLHLFNRLSKICRRHCFIGRQYCSSITDTQNEILPTKNTFDEFHKEIGLTMSAQKAILKQKPVFNENMRTLKVAIIGAPNVGKSTLANRLIGWKFAPVSQKVHTTRSKTIGVLTEETKQVIFMDTPGVIVPTKMKKHNLEMSLLVDPHQALNESDMILVVVDASHLWHRTHLDPEVLKMLSFHKNKQSVLVINKVDAMKTKHELLNTVRVLTQGCLEGTKYQKVKVSNKKEEKKETVDLDALFEKNKNLEDWDSDLEEINIKDFDKGLPFSDDDDEDFSDVELEFKDDDRLRGPDKTYDLRDATQWQIYYRKMGEIGRSMREQYGWPHFKDVFMVSALQGEGLFELKNYLLESTRQSSWVYNGKVITNQDPTKLARYIVWEKILDNLREEIPYRIRVKLHMWNVGEDDLLRAQFILRCNRRRDVESLLGTDGKTIQKISAEVKQELMNAFRREMSLSLIVRGTPETKQRSKK